MLPAPLWRAVAIVAVTLPVLGCPLPLGTGTPQTVQLENRATVQVRVRIGAFKPGGGVKEDQMLEEALIAPTAKKTFTLSTGRYNIEALAISQKSEVGTTFFDLTASRPGRLILQEQLVDEFQPVGPGATPPPVQQAERTRVLSWIEE